MSKLKIKEKIAKLEEDNVMLKNGLGKMQAELMRQQRIIADLQAKNLNGGATKPS